MRQPHPALEDQVPASPGKRRDAVNTADAVSIADGKLTMAETLKKGSTLNYEAAYTTKGGKKKEVIVTAEGVEVK